MLSSGQEKFLTYYHRELTYLRQAGQLFAEKHPKIGRRLQLSSQESPDPHTERLIESFAFMTARLRQEIDDRLPQISSALLGILYPQLVSPVPAMSIAQFVVDPSQGKLTTGANVPKHTALFTYAEEGVACQFRTTYPVTLWPIEIDRAEFTMAEQFVLKGESHKSYWYLKLRLKAVGVDFSDLDISSLRFYIDGENGLNYHIYSMLFAQEHHQIFVSTENNNFKKLPEDSIKPVGFGINEGLLPSPDHAHPAYQFIHEYFHFPQKFLFFDIHNLDFKEGTDFVDILISLKGTHHHTEKLAISANNFKLGCTPIVNLFPKVTDPLRLDHQKFEYRLVPDQRRERTTEIYSIEKITLTYDSTHESEVVIPYFSFKHEDFEEDPQLFWLSRRVPTEKRSVPGTDIYVSFVDLAFNAKLPPSEIIFAHTLCTNRFLGDQIPEGGILQMEESLPLSQIICLRRPTTQVYSPEDGETLWQLVAQLSINHLSISVGDSSLQALKEMLRLFSRSAKYESHKEIDALKKIKTRAVTRRFGGEAWRGYVNGLHIELTVDERSYTGESVFLLATVLRHFFALQVSANSFVELQLNSLQREGEWMRWKPLHGDQILL